MKLESAYLRWIDVRWYRSMQKYDQVKYNKTSIDVNLLRIEFLRTNYYQRFEIRNDIYEDIVVSINDNLEEGECFVYIDNEVPTNRLHRLEKILKDRYNQG